jgi:hypothetical protein
VIQWCDTVDQKKKCFEVLEMPLNSFEQTIKELFSLFVQAQRPLEQQLSNMVSCNTLILFIYLFIFEILF